MNIQAAEEDAAIAMGDVEQRVEEIGSRAEIVAAPDIVYLLLKVKVAAIARVKSCSF